MDVEISLDGSSRDRFASKDNAPVSSANSCENTPKRTSNESRKFNGTKEFDVDDYLEEDERLNIESWEYFNVLTAVVNKIDRLNEILLQIQMMLMPPGMIKK